MRLDTATKEILEYQKRMAEIELHSEEQVRYSEVIDGLNVEKATLLVQLESLRGELEKQKEDTRKAKIEASKVWKLFHFEICLLRSDFELVHDLSA